jgi:hypothetical protein
MRVGAFEKSNYVAEWGRNYVKYFPHLLAYETNPFPFISQIDSENV